MSTMTSTFPRLLAVTALAGGLAFASPVYAAPADNGASAVSAATPASAPVAKHAHKPGQDVETRIKTLHDKLKITADQEDAFNTLAQAMRDNEASLKAAVSERHTDVDTKTAVEDLESYQKVAQAHADGLGKVIDAFKPLYDSFSDDQKKNADEVFGRFEGHRDVAPAAKTGK